MKTLLLTLTALFLAVPSFASDLPGYSSLFNIEKSSNANYVVYEVNLSNPSNPVHPYWVMKAEDGHYEELNNLERTEAFGVTITSRNTTALQFEIAAFPSHPITVQINPQTKAPYALMNIFGGEKVLVDVYVHVSGFLVPTVSQVDVTYRDSLTGPIQKQSFKP